MNDIEKKELITIGKIVKTHGIHGKLRIKYYNEDKNYFSSYREILLMDSAGHLEPFRVTEAKSHRKLIVVHLEGVENLDQAAHLIGASILVEKASLPELEEGEYYCTDLIGMEVTTAGGDRVGEVLDIIPTGGTDVFVITAGEREILIPATEEVIKEVDTASRRMVVCLLEGLREDDSV